MVQLTAMTEADFQAYLEIALDDLAEDYVLAGEWLPEQALGKARRYYDKMLPQGPDTPGEHLCTIEDVETGKRVGFLWFAVGQAGTRGTVFLSDIIVLPECRGRGYGKGALIALEAKVRDLGARHISLHVFEHNARARRLYETLGYQVTGHQMRKDLDAT